MVIGIVLAVWQPFSAPAAAPIPAPAATPTVGPIGGVDWCRAGPRFQTALGLSRQAASATSLTDIKGLAILDPTGNNGTGSLYQHETWDDAGFLGPFITDRQGNIYTAPVPLVSLVDNPLEQQNRIYRVDTDSQVMSLFSELPPALPFSGANPFGVVGLAYDCGTDSLYATSLAGPTAGQDAGASSTLISKLNRCWPNLKAWTRWGWPCSTAWAASGSTTPGVWWPRRASSCRTWQGNFVGEPRGEFSFANKATGGRRTIRRIRFTTPGEMTLHTMDFNYSLQVASERKEDVLTYRYDPASDGWTFVKIDTAKRSENRTQITRTTQTFLDSLS